MISTAIFFIFTGFSVNLAVQFGLGIRDIAMIKQFRFKYSLCQGLVLFLSVLVTWFVFAIILVPLRLDFLETLLLLPLSILSASFIEKGILFFLSRWISPMQSSVFSAYNGLVFGANFFVLKVSGSFLEALIMAAGFGLGYILSMAVLLEIQRRSAIETVPKALRGAPLLLISLALLSLLCSSALFFLRMIDIF